MNHSMRVICRGKVLALPVSKLQAVCINLVEVDTSGAFLPNIKDYRLLEIGRTARLFASYESIIFCIHMERMTIYRDSDSEPWIKFDFQEMLTAMRDVIVLESKGIMLIAAEKGLFSLNIKSADLASEQPKSIIDGLFNLIQLSNNKKYLVGGGEKLNLIDVETLTLMYQLDFNEIYKS
jgi:hypothetical protein